MCETALIFHTSFEEMESWDFETLLARRNRALKMATAIYG